MTRAGMHAGGHRVRAARLCPALAACLFIGACERSPASSPGGLHDRKTVPDLIGQRMMSCDDDARADVDFLNDGLEMAVTWLPGGKAVRLRAPATGEEYRGSGLKATVAGGSIAFTLANDAVRTCHRIEEED